MSDTAWDDVQHLIDQAIAGLPDELRVPVVEHYLMGQTLQSVGEEIGISRQAVSRRIQKGVDRIRAELRDKGVPVAPVVLAGGFSEMAKSQPSPGLQKGLLNSAVGGIDADTLVQVATTKTIAVDFTGLLLREENPPRSARIPGLATSARPPERRHPSGDSRA